MTRVLLSEESQGVTLDFLDYPHLLVAGATGSGKSCMLHRIITQIILNDPNAELLLIDPKRVEFFDYESYSSLYTGKVVETPKKALSALSELCEEMNERYRMLRVYHKRNSMEMASLNDIYVVIDELSFLMLENKKECEEYLSKIGMLGRACGIHLVLATQHPDRKTITGTIQANLSAVIGLAVRQAVDSRMIIGNNSLTTLKGKGDAILQAGLEEMHFQGAYVSPEDIQKVVSQPDTIKMPVKIRTSIKQYLRS